MLLVFMSVLFVPVTFAVLNITVHADTSAVYYPNSLTFIGNNCLIIADNEGIKLQNIDTKNIEMIVQFGNRSDQIPFSKNVVFDGFDTVFIQDEAEPVKIYVYNITTGNLNKKPDPTPAVNFNEEIKDVFGNDAALPPNTDILDITADKYNGIIYYIDMNHKIQTQKITNWWTFFEHRNEHYNYKDINTKLQSSDHMLYETNKDAILYEFPLAINPIKKTAANTAVILLDATPVFDGKITEFSEWRYVLTEADGIAAAGYLRADCLNEVSNWQTGNLANCNVRSVKFMTADNYIGRVIRNNAPIYKYPTTIDLTMTVGHAEKTLQSRRETAISINRLILIPDFSGWYFFEVDITDEDGNKTGVGFIPTNYVIDINAKSDFQKVTPNATINAKTAAVTLYADEACLRPILDPVTGETETLPNNARIRTIDFKSSKNSTHIVYSDPEIGEWHQIEGYIKTSVITPDTLTKTQWLGISMLSSLALGAVFTIVFLKIRKRIRRRAKRRG